MLAAVTVPTAGWGTDDERGLPGAAGETLELGHVVEHGIESDGDEVDHVELDDRPQARHRGTGGNAEERRLADRRCEHAVGAEAREERRPQHRRVLADENDRVITRHRIFDGAIDRPAQAHLRHDRPPPPLPAPA